MIRVCEANLGGLAELGAGIPGYDRRGLKKRVVHLGLGHFHRAHQALYVDELLNRGLTDTGIVAVNLIPDVYPLGETAAGQDYLYTLTARGPGGEEDIRVVGSILGYLNAAARPEEGLELLSRPETVVISLTITEKGYCYDTVKGDLVWEGDLLHDARRPEEPRTAIGFVAAALDRRRRAGGGPLTLMSCDNFPSNGRVLARCVLSFCRAVRPELVPWIEEHVSFPLSMVDRITPGTTGAFREDLAQRRGIADDWAVGCEDFRQWVLEANFRENFPLAALGEAGVQIVGDVEPYERMKIRLLNGSHSALSYPAFLLGCRGVAEAVEDPLLRRFIRDFYMEQIGAAVPGIPGMEDYKDTLIRRFSNRNIADTVLRLASDGSKKIPNAILAPLAELVRAGAGPRQYGAVSTALACWARFLCGKDEKGEAIPLDDPAAAELSAAAGEAREKPAAFLRAIRMPEAGEPEALAKDFAFRLGRIYTLGVRGALEELVQGG